MSGASYRYAMVFALLSVFVPAHAWAQQSPTSPPNGYRIFPPVLRYYEPNVPDRVFFGMNSDEISPKSAAILDKQAGWLTQFPEKQLVIEGHSDERGSKAYNYRLGKRRAEAVKDYLVAHGIAAERLEVLSYGKDRPAVPIHAEFAWSQNRRAVSVVAGH